MAYLTDRKRATGLGASKTGTEHHWAMTVSSYGLLIITPLFLLSVGPLFNQPIEAVQAHFAKAYPAIITALMLVVGLQHFKNGIRIFIEDYTGGHTRHLLLVAAACFSYGLMAAGLFALVKMAL